MCNDVKAFSKIQDRIRDGGESLVLHQDINISVQRFMLKLLNSGGYDGY